MRLGPRHATITLANMVYNMARLMVAQPNCAA
jgi:hypothetical protein